MTRSGQLRRPCSMSHRCAALQPIWRASPRRLTPAAIRRRDSHAGLTTRRSPLPSHLPQARNTQRSMFTVYACPLPPVKPHAILPSMGAHCTICESPARDEFNAAVLAGEPVRWAAKRLNAPQSACYRHVHAGHHLPKPQQGPQNGHAPTIAPGNVPSPSQAITATLRDVQRVAREAQRNLKAARLSNDIKATNGAITAASKALELVGKLRGELQGALVTVNASATAEARTAMDMHSAALASDAGDVTEQARTWLSAQLEAGDAQAIAAVGELLRMLPSADGGSTS